MNNVIEIHAISKAKKLELEYLRLKAFKEMQEAIEEMMRIDKIIGKGMGHWLFMPHPLVKVPFI